jgi:hypothetical protein
MTFKPLNKTGLQFQYDLTTQKKCFLFLKIEVRKVKIEVRKVKILVSQKAYSHYYDS